MTVLRLILLALIVWIGGFVVFLMSLGAALDPDKRTDAIVVLTGGPGRVDRGVALMQAQAAKRMLVSGVGRDVKPRELAVQFHADNRLFTCCIDLGHQAVDTRSNAEETAAWMKQHGFRTVRLITTDWHMPRARLELSYALDKDIELLADPVPSPRRFRTLFGEYNKYLVRRIALLAGMN